MASAEPEEGILGVFKLASNALADAAPGLEYTTTDSAPSSSYENEDVAENSEEPAISESYTNSSGTYSHGSSSFGSSYDDSSYGRYRMEYHAFGNHSIEEEEETYASDESGSYDEDDSEPGDEDSDVFDGDSADVFDGVLQPEQEFSAHSTLSRIADALFMSKPQIKPTKSSPKVVEIEDSEAVEVTAEDSFRTMRTLSSDIKDAEQWDHRGHRRHVSVPLVTAPKKHESPSSANKTVQVEAQEEATTELVGDTKIPLVVRPPKPVTPRSTWLVAGTPTSVSMAGVGKPPLKPADEQKRKSSFAVRSINVLSPKAADSPGRGSGHSRSSSLSFGFPTPKSAEKPSTPKKTSFAATNKSAEPHVIGHTAGSNAIEERDPAESEPRARSSSERGARSASSNPTMFEDPFGWQWGSTNPSAHEGRDPANRAKSPRPPTQAIPPKRAPPKSVRVAHDGPESWSVVQEKKSGARSPQKVSQLFKVAKKAERIQATRREG